MTQRDRRAVVLGAGAILTAFLTLRVVPWGIRTSLTAREGLEERVELLAHTQQELAEAPALRDSAAAITQALGGLASKLLSGSTATDAGADLSAQLNLAAARHSAKVERLEVLADSARAGHLGRAQVHVILETDVRGLMGVLQAIAAANTALVLENLRVIASDPDSAEGQPELLRVEMTVYGWYPRT